MTIKKKTLPETTKKTSFEEDEYYVVEKKRIAEEAQKAHKIHELEVHSHMTAMIPYYEESDGDDRRRLLLFNNLLISRFEQPGMMYWNIFRRAPTEIRDYADLFGNDFSESDQAAIIYFLEQKQIEEKNMVDMGFDEDGEEDKPGLIQDTAEDDTMGESDPEEEI